MVRAGGIQKEFTVTKPDQLFLLDFEEVANADRIELVIPKPTSGKELGVSEETRKLGVDRAARWS